MTSRFMVSSSLFFLLAALLFSVTLSRAAYASGVVPGTSVVIVEESDGEGTISVTNTDAWPVLMLTTLIDLPEDTEPLLMVTPPAARVDPGKTQLVRFLLKGTPSLKTERLKRVIFEGVPPQQKGKNEVRMTVRQNLPVIIRPAGLAKEASPWTKLTWQFTDNTLVVKNPSPYVVRLAQSVQTLPDNTSWTLPHAYVLPGQTLTLTAPKGSGIQRPGQVRLSPATTWGFSVDTYDAALTH